MTTSYEVRIWGIRVRKVRRMPYQVRWRVGNSPVSHKSFATRGLADSFRSELIQAARRGEAFDTDTGLPQSQLRMQCTLTWYEHALDYIDMKCLAPLPSLESQQWRHWWQSPRSWYALTMARPIR